MLRLVVLLFTLSLGLGSAEEEPLLKEVVGVLWNGSLGVVEVLCDGGRTIQTFDLELRPLSQRGTTQDLLHPTLRTEGPSGRPLFWDSTTDMLTLGMASWEAGPSAEVGGNWATVRFRSVRPLGPYLEWKSTDGTLHLAELTHDRNDPLLQRAILRGIKKGEVLQMRHFPQEFTYPAKRWTSWKKLTVPKPTSTAK